MKMKPGANPRMEWDKEMAETPCVDNASYNVVISCRNIAAVGIVIFNHIRRCPKPTTSHHYGFHDPRIATHMLLIY